MRLTLLVFGMISVFSLYSQKNEKSIGDFNKDYSVFLEPTGIIHSKDIYEKFFNSSNSILSLGIQKKINDRNFISISITVPLSLSYRTKSYFYSSSQLMNYYYSPYSNYYPNVLLYSITPPSIIFNSNYHGYRYTQRRNRDLLFQTGFSEKFYWKNRKWFTFFCEPKLELGIMDVYQFDYYDSFTQTSPTAQWKLKSEEIKVSRDVRFFVRPQFFIGFTSFFGTKYSLDIKFGACPRLLYKSNKPDRVFMKKGEGEFELIYSHLVNNKVNIEYGDYDQKDRLVYFNPLIHFTFHYNFNWKKDE